MNRLARVMRKTHLEWLALLLCGCGWRSLDVDACRLSATGGESQAGQGGGGGASQATGGTTAETVAPYFLIRAESSQETTDVYSVTWTVTGTLEVKTLIAKGASCVGCVQESLSPDGNFASLQVNTLNGLVNGLSMINLRTGASYDLYDRWFTHDQWQVRTQWVDNRRLFLEMSSLTQANVLQEILVQIGEGAFEPIQGNVQSRAGVSSAFSIAPDGQWAVGRIRKTTDEYDLSVAAVEKAGLGPTITVSSGRGDPSGEVTFAPDSSSAILHSSNPPGNNPYTTFFGFGTEPPRVTNSGLTQDWGPVAYSATANLSYWPQYCAKGTLPIVTVASSLLRDIQLPDEETWCALVTNPTDEYLALRSGARLAVARLRNAYVNEIQPPVAMLLVEHSTGTQVERPVFVHEGREIVYEVVETGSSWRGVFLLDIDAPLDSQVRLSDVLGNDFALGKYVAPQGDYVAIPTATRLYLVKLERPTSVEVIEGFAKSEPFDATTQFAWAHDGSGLIVVASSPVTRIYFVPRELTPAGQFGAVRSVEISRVPSDRVSLTLPRRSAP